VDFLSLITREGGYEFGQHAVRLPGRELVLVKEIRGSLLLAEKEPVLAFRARSFAFLQKCAEWSDACPRPHHDRGRVRILGNPEMFGGMHKYRHFSVAFGAFSQKG